jgi:hypothetical protein
LPRPSVKNCQPRKRRLPACGVWTYQSLAQSGLKSVAQGLPRVVLRTRIRPEGATRYGDNRLGTFACPFLAPSGRNVYFRLTRVNPGLSYFGHFGPRIETWLKASGRRAHAPKGTILRGFGAFLQELQNSRCLFAGGFALVLSPT